MTIIQNFARIVTFLQQQVADLISMSILADEIIVKPVVADSAAAQPDAIYRVVRRLQVQQVEYVVETAASAESIAPASDDSVAAVPQPKNPQYQPYRDDNIAHNVRPSSRRHSLPDGGASLPPSADTTFLHLHSFISQTKNRIHLKK